MSLQLSRGFGLFLALSSLIFAANCSGKDVSPERAEFDAQLNPSGDAEVIGLGTPDPGATRNNCGQRDAVELLVQHDFEASFSDGCTTDAHPDEQLLYAALYWYVYSDSTTRFFYPKRLEFRAPQTALPGTGWGIDAYPAMNLPGGSPCGSGGVLRIWGGKFTGWGGGLGSGYFQATPGQAMVGPFDASAYDGVAFWARRGPDGQATLRINVVDEAISEEAAKAAYAQDGVQPFCQIAPKCGCLNGAPCTFYEPLNGYYCFDPAVDPAPDAPRPDPNACPVINADGALEPYTRPSSDSVTATPKCGDTACSDPLLTFGPGLNGACTTHLFENGLTGDFCGEDVPEPTERCGNGWSAIVQVGTEWQLYTVPWSELQQADYAYKGAGLDPTKLYSLSFGFIGGWVDFYIDDVSFYRKL